MPRSFASRPRLTPPLSAPLRGAGSHQIRIIGGRWRRTPIAVADVPGLRPTPDRVRETLFNWLGQDLSGWRCLDAFAGTGALGVEAASRGASHVLALEQSPLLVRQLQRLLERLKPEPGQAIEVQCVDTLASMARLPAASFDLVFLDPPFDAPWFEAAVQAACRLVPVGGWVYLEAPVRWRDDQLMHLGLDLARHLKAGAVHAHLLRRTA